ncbi:MAG: hypothetical protein JO293_06070 [Candidatus Eremiobacteraeota bacterium]|nr:hypothetical protein [Candidatus Eremiobacteraeota bacterium]MBV8282244.1 hypothetical protein [Candidatus Eremiobacteraeota bacterium]
MKILVSLACLALAVIACAHSAAALGTATVQKVDKPIDTYNNVRIVFQPKKALLITSADGQGTLIIDKAACSYVGDIQTCLPTSVKLKQNGTVSPIDILKGTVYANLTGQSQPLSNSSMRLPPNGILMSVTTKIGTIINVTGVIDTVTK